MFSGGVPSRAKIGDTRFIDVVVTDWTSEETPLKNSLKIRACRDLCSVNFCGNRKLFIVADDTGHNSEMETTCYVTLRQIPNQVGVRMVTVRMNSFCSGGTIVLRTENAVWNDLFLFIECCLCFFFRKMSTF